LASEPSALGHGLAANRDVEPNQRGTVLLRRVKPSLVAMAFALMACGPAGPTHEPGSAPDAGQEDPSQAKSPQDDQRQAPLESQGEHEPSLKLLRTESFGPLRIGLPDQRVSDLLGPAEALGAAEVWGADGLVHQEWRYPHRGLKIEMVSSTKGGPSEVASMTVASPCKLRTRRGIGVGDLENKVRAVYRDVADNEMPLGNDRLIVGSVYGGLVFSFDHGKVSEIFLGASAE
jgi:hypothetical protein